MPRKRVLITGGLGFQGFHLATKLLATDHEVTVLNTPSPRASRLASLLPWNGVRDPNLHVVYGSVADMEILEKTLPEQHAVVHMAAWASVDVSLDRPWPPFEINAQGTYALLDGLRRMNPEARVVVASSCEVYGPANQTRESTHVPPEDGSYPTAENVRFIPAGTPMPQHEEWPLMPRSPYAATKIATDRFAYAFAVTYNLRLTILRPCNVYGPHQRSGAQGAVIPTFVKAALRGYPLVITGGGQQFREFLHVTDLVDAYVATLETETPPGETFNVGSGETATIQSLAEGIAARTTSGRHPVQIIYGSKRVADVSGFLLDSAKFRMRFGWKPDTTLAAGLDAYVTWATHHLDQL